MVKVSLLENIYFSVIFFLLILFSFFNLSNMDNVLEEGNSNFVIIFTLSLFAFSLPYLIFMFKDLFRCHVFRVGKIIFLFGIFYFFIFFSSFVFSDLDINIKGLLFSFIKNMLPFLSLLISYLYVKRNGLTYCFDLGVLVLFLFLVYGYFSIYSVAILLDGGQHIGVAYWVLFILPLIMINRFKFFRIVAVLIVLIVLFSSMKRAGIVAFALSFGGYIYYLLKGSKQNLVVKCLFFGVIIAFFSYMFYFLGTYGDNYIFDRFENIGEDEGSGRLDVWAETIRLIFQSDFIGLLLGHGDNAVMRDSVLFLSAHNDFLEIIYDYGFLSFSVLLIILFLLLILFIQLNRSKSMYVSVVFQLYIIVFVLMCISHVVIYPWMVLVCFSLGVFFALIERECLNIK